MVGSDYCLATYLLTKDGDKSEVLCEVPSYEEWQRILHYASKYEHEYTSCAMDYENLKEENIKLKELLKECYVPINEYSIWDESEILHKISHALGEE